jgi:hypothetical protein
MLDHLGAREGRNFTSISIALIHLVMLIINWDRVCVQFWVGIDHRVLELDDSSNVMVADLDDLF